MRPIKLLSFGSVFFYLLSVVFFIIDSGIWDISYKINIDHWDFGLLSFCVGTVLFSLSSKLSIKKNG
jgi:hypothetical protein